MNSFSHLPAHARVWIYQANRRLSDAEVAELDAAGNVFLSEWLSHGQKMHAGFKVLHNFFLIFSVDQTAVPPGGCSIDKSVRFVIEAGNKYGIDVTDRLQVAFKNNKGEIEVVHKNVFESLFREGKVSGNTEIFNNLIQTKEELEKEWLIPVSKSWLGPVLA